MKLPAADRARIKAEGLAKIALARENDARKALLGECFNNYIKLDEAGQAEFARLRAAQPPEVDVMYNSFKIEAQEELLRRLVPKLIEQKFGSLSPFVAGQLSAMPPDRLEEIALKYAQVDSLAALGLGEPSPSTPTTKS